MPVGHASVAHPQHHEGATDLDLYRTFSPSDVGMWSWEAGVPVASAVFLRHSIDGQEQGAGALIAFVTQNTLLSSLQKVLAIKVSNIVLLAAPVLSCSWPSVRSCLTMCTS